MNCERCKIELEDFLYGELAERLAAEVREHLADCSGCLAERNRLENENVLFAEFYEQTAIDPLPESWEAIRARIAAEPVHFNQSVAQESKASWWQAMFGWLVVPTLARQAALAVLLVAVSVAATFLLMRRSDNGKNDGRNIARQEPTPTQQVIVTPSPAPMPATDFAQAEPKKMFKPSAGNKASEPLSDQQVLARQLARTEREYQSAIKLLDQAVAKRRSGIDPEAFKKYESSLALIDSSIAQSKRALRELPNDLVAGQFLLAAYAKKVELMQEIAMCQVSRHRGLILN